MVEKGLGSVGEETRSTKQRKQDQDACKEALVWTLFRLPPEIGEFGKTLS